MSHDEDPYASLESQEKLRQERAANYRELRKLSTPNRFRLMFGQPLLSDQGEPQDHEPTSTQP